MLMNEQAANLRLRTAVHNREWVWEEIPVLVMETRLPEPEPGLPDRRIRRIERYYHNYAACYERYCGRFIFPAASSAFRTALESGKPFLPWRAELKTTVTAKSETLLSLYIDAKETAYGECISHLRRADTWNLLDGYPFHLSDFFPGELLWRRSIQRTARESLLSRSEDGPTLREDWKRRLRTEFNPENFYLTERGLVFYYQWYSLGEAALGTPSFLLTWNKEKVPRLPAGISLSPSLDKGDAPVVS